MACGVHVRGWRPGAYLSVDVSAVGRIRGRARRGYLDLPPTIAERQRVRCGNDGSRVEAEGCDLFTFANGKIVRKQAFRKNRPVLQPRY